jgi:hypothetical protein
MSTAVLQKPAAAPGRFRQMVDALNGRYHRAALYTFLAIVLAHWVEHIAQAVQIFVLGMERPEAGGFLGLLFPWLVKTEALHYFYAIVMLAGLLLLRPGFTGRARGWWDAAIVIQFWHHIEHALLLGQAVVGTNLFGSEVPTSIAQLVVPRAELHLLYNGLVFIPMVVAMILHARPSEQERHEVSCTCARETRRERAVAGAR